MDIEMKIKEEATFWITCEKEGFNQTQKKQFQNWLNENSLHQKAYDRMKVVHSMYSSLSKTNAQKLSQKANKDIRKSKLLLSNKIVSSAAVIILVLCIGVFINYPTNSLEFSRTYASNTNKIHKQKLPDGSIISLDAQTNLNIHFYKNKRVAVLKNGKAMFEVAKNKQRPFIIETLNANIEVVGTRFEVISSKKDTKINVQEGKVRTYYLTSNHKKRSTIILNKADTITYSNGGNISHYKKIDPKEIALWRNDLIHLDQINLKHAIEKFSKYSQKPIKISSQEVENYLITGEFSSNQIDIFLNTLTKIYPISVTYNHEFIEISKKN